MELKLLADVPEAVPIVAQWYFDEWGFKREDNSLEKTAERVQAMQNRDAIPVMVVAVEGNEIRGAAHVKLHEMDIYPEKEYWLGGVYVAPGARSRGLAARMVRRCVELAEGFGVKTLYLQTRKLDGGLYARLGWRPIEQVDYKGVRVLVMERSL
jgi:N-acetylglutamate synthase-like GNAT family acetyltransferase